MSNSRTFAVCLLGVIVWGHSGCESGRLVPGDDASMEAGSSGDIVVADASVDSVAIDASVDSVATDASVDDVATDASVDSVVTDASVDSMVTDTSADSVATDASVDSQVTDAATPDTPQPVMADYYVAPNGDDNGPGTIDQPFATLEKAHSVVSAGQLIYMRGGNYQPSSTVVLSKSGQSGALIRLFAYPGEQPVIDCIQLTGMYTYCLQLKAASYWHLHGIEVKNGPDTGILLDNASNNTLESIETHHHGRESQYDGEGLMLVSNSDNNLILNSESHHNYDVLGYGPNGGGNADGFAIKSPDCDGNIFRGCRAWRNSDDGFDFWNASSPVVIEDTQVWENGYDDQFTPLGDGNGFKLGGTNIGVDTGGHTLIRCVAWGNRANGFDYNGSTLANTLFNNTAWDNQGHNYAFSSGSHVLRNNIAYQGSNGLGSGVVSSHNTWDLGISDPMFVSTQPTSSQFLHLSPTSPAIDVGMDVGLPYLGSAPDLGAFEAQ